MESIAHFSAEELRETGVSEALLKDPGYVKARGALDGIDLFDAEFFGFTPKEAAITDPQHRLFLECVHEALEDADCVAVDFEGTISLYAGAANSGYLERVLSDAALTAAIGPFKARIGTDKDHLATGTAFRLDLRGPT